MTMAASATTTTTTTTRTTRPRPRASAKATKATKAAKAAAEVAATGGRKVRFAGAACIEFDATRAPVVRHCGAGRRSWLTPETPTKDSGGSTCLDLVLEWRARRVATADDDDGDESMADGPIEGGPDPPSPDAIRAELAAAYANEIRATLAHRGFPVIDAALVALPIQLEVAEALATAAALAHDDTSSDDNKPSRWWDDDQGDRDEPAAAAWLQALGLRRKDLRAAPSAPGYTFGRRFFTVEAYLSTLSLDELTTVAQELGVSPATDPMTAARTCDDSSPIPDAQLVATRAASAEGKPLKRLTLRELVEEAHAHGLVVDGDSDQDAVDDSQDELKEPRENGVRDRSRRRRRPRPQGTKSKRYWVDRLRPVLQDELRRQEAQERAAAALQEVLEGRLEAHARRDQRRRVRALARELLLDLEARTPDPDKHAALRRYLGAVVDNDDVNDSDARDARDASS